MALPHAALEPQELLRRIYERDRPAFFAHMHPEFVCRTPGRSPIAGSFIGKEGMTRHIEQMSQLTGGSFRPRHLGAFITDGEWGFVPVHLVGERLGRRLDQPAFGVWRFREGLVAEHWENPTDMQAFDDFWA